MPLSGTGSYPALQNGLHLSSLQRVRIDPTKNPRFVNASIAYSEQVGVNLQLGGSRGDINFLYKRTNHIIKCFIVYTLYIPSDSKARSRCASTCCDFMPVAPLLAAITIRKPTFSGRLFSRARSPSRMMRLHRLRTTAEPSLVDVVKPMRFIIFFSGWALASLLAW